MQDHLQEVHGELTESHMKYAMERFYWLHMSLFPHNHRLTSETVVEVKALLTWALTDQLTSLTSPTQYTAAQLTELISLVDKVKDILTDDRATATVGRILADFAWSQFLNYHGEYGARLNSNQSVHNHDPPRRSSLMSAIFLTLFNAPITHWDWIKDIYTDDIVRTLTWKEHLNKLKDDWQECILCSTVLLNANVAFLAVPHLIPDDMTSSTTGQVASYLSLLTSAGSVIIGLLLQRQHRIHSMGDAWDAHQYLTHYMKCVGSTEMLAVVYSLPYGLLMWAMIAFLVAIAFECFNTQNIPTIAMSSVALVILVGLILWCAYAGSHTSQVTEERAPRRVGGDPDLESGLPRGSA
ncbi:hypothetical protein BDW22DRAFT_1352569 [Trametopsis cervina]|nr:hypothetical protein BDW22DRAFT_1352569 [Trametopsis cervina]